MVLTSKKADHQKLRDAVNAWIEERDITLRELASKMGVSYATVYGFLRYGKSISKRMALKFINAIAS